MQEFIVPSSKSISNRLLIIKYLSQSQEKINNLSLADDTLLMQTLLNKIDTYNSEILFCDNAGTVTRFLIALLALKEGIWKVDADSKMRERPINPLLESLRELGAKIEHIENQKKLPIQIVGGLLKGGKTIRIDSKLSSQFISSLLLISPYIEKGLSIELNNDTVSMPYIEMTISLMKDFGAKINKIGNNLIISRSEYFFKGAEVENDWSSACYAFEKLCILKEGTLFIKNLIPNSLQADAVSIKHFSHFGIQSSFENKGLVIKYNAQHISKENEILFDVEDSPDMFPSLAMASLFSNKKVIFKGIRSLEQKESDRIKSMLEGMKKIGANVNLEDNKFIISGFYKQVSEDIIINTYNDHRIAMAFAIASLKLPNIKIDNKDCVSKSFPMFWDNI
ncbi:MAG: 3-phosphoshikimate 1-carboxyvinyltransferase [Bacteroidales bacterium]